VNIPPKVRAWSAAAAACALTWLAAGCAPRYLNKTPDNALRYPYIPVSTEELANYQAMIAIAPRDVQSAKAAFWIAQDAFNQQKWQRAEKGFTEVFETYPQSEWAPVARLMAARARVKLHRAFSALGLLQPLLRSQAPSSPALQDSLATLGRDIINDELTLAELGQVRIAFPNTVWAEQALFVAGKRKLDAGLADEAVQQFGVFIQLYPRSEFAPLAQDLIDRAMQLVPVSRNRIGCLVPLTGPYAPYGQAIRQGLELALAQLNAHRAETDRLKLITADSQGTTEGAVAGLQRLGEVDKVFVVLGPALSSSARALVPWLDRLHLPVITPSASEPGLTGQSTYLLRYLLTNEQQGEAMAEYVVLRGGQRRLAILHSQDRYDSTLAESFAAKASQLGAEIIAELDYPPGTTDFKSQMLELGGLDPSQMKKLEVTERKQLETAMNLVAHRAAVLMAPGAQARKETGPDQPTPVPGKKVAIIRFTEQGEQTEAETLGKRITERFSYSLAAQPGLEVLTQRKTFDALRQLGLSPLSQDGAGWRRLGAALSLDYLVVGAVTQEAGETVAEPGEPLPVSYQIEVRVISPSTGRTVERYTQKWVKHLPPQANPRGIQAVYLPVSVEDALLLVPQLAFYDLRVGVYGPDAWLSPRLLRQGAEVFEGAVLATGFWLENPQNRSRDFIQQFEDMFSTPPSLLSAQAYDAMNLVARVLNRLPRVNPKREEFLRLLQMEKNIQGVTGTAWVEPDGEIRREPIFLRVQKGKLHRVQ